MRGSLGKAVPFMQVKASGGVRELDFVLAAREVGVTRCGSSRTREILDECRMRFAIAEGGLRSS